jgi:nicotinate-nucleotide adenylyltransferase
MPESVGATAPGPLGVLGGTFDPVHFGHLRLAEEAAGILGLAGVIWLPAGRPPHRRLPVAAAEHRLAMVRLAVAGREGFEVDSGEVETAAPSYTVVSLERLRMRFGRQRPLVLLLGGDAFAGLAAWHRWRELFDLAHIAVATRPGVDLAAGALDPVLAEELRRRSVNSRAELHARPAGAILGISMTPLAISATALRETLAGGGSPRYLLPDGVLDYIRRNHLYTD